MPTVRGGETEVRREMTHPVAVWYLRGWPDISGHVHCELVRSLSLSSHLLFFSLWLPDTKSKHTYKMHTQLGLQWMFALESVVV